MISLTLEKQADIFLLECDAAKQGDQRLQSSNVETGPATVRPHRSRLEHRPQQQAHRQRIVGRLRQGNVVVVVVEKTKIIFSFFLSGFLSFSRLLSCCLD
jgi:hypothetical protein